MAFENPADAMRNATVRQVITWTAAIILAGGLYLVFQPFLQPLTWAAVLAVFFYPLHRSISRRVRGQGPAALTTTTLVTVLLILPAALVMPFLIREALNVLGTLPSSGLLESAEHALGTLKQNYPGVMPGDDLAELVGQVRNYLAEASARVAGNLALSIFDLGLTLFALFYFFRDGQEVLRLVSQLTMVGQERWDRIMAETTDMVRVTVSTTFAVAGLQGAAGALVFALMALPSPVLWGLVMSMVSIVPVLGAWLVWFPVSAWLLLSGDTFRGVMLGVLGGLIVPFIDNLVRPMMIAGRSRLNPLLVLVSVLGGLKAFGFLGVVLGPVLTATAVGLLKAFADEVEEPSVENQPALTAPAPVPSANALEAVIRN